MRDILAGRLGARAVLVGDNFRFGHEHAGDTRAAGGARASGYGFEVEVVQAIHLRGRTVSSSAVRRTGGGGPGGARGPHARDAAMRWRARW